MLFTVALVIESTVNILKLRAVKIVVNCVINLNRKLVEHVHRTDKEHFEALLILKRRM